MSAGVFSARAAAAAVAAVAAAGEDEEGFAPADVLLQGALIVQRQTVAHRPASSVSAFNGRGNSTCGHRTTTANWSRTDHDDCMSVKCEAWTRGRRTWRRRG